MSRFPRSPRFQALLPALIGVFAVLAVTATPSPADAREDIPAVQLAPFAVPAHRKSGTRQMMSVTMFLELKHPDQIEPVCRLAPRLKETSLSVMGAAQLKIVKNKLDLRQVDLKIRDALNRLFVGTPVRKVYILQGRQNIGSGTGQRLGNVLGCSRVVGFNPDQLR